MTTVAVHGTTAVEPEEKTLISPRPLDVEESLSTDGHECKDLAQLAARETSGAAPGPASATESAAEQVAQASGTAVNAATAAAENAEDSTETAVKADAAGAESAGDSATTAVDAALGAEKAGDSAATAVEAAGARAENVGDSTKATDEDVQQGLSVSVSVEEPARDAAATPRAGTAGKSGKTAKRLSLIARQPSQGAELRRKSGRGIGRDSSGGEVVPKGGDRPASRRALKPATVPTSARNKSAQPPKRVSLVARQTSAASAGLRGSGSGSESGTTNDRAKPASKAEPKPAPSGARSTERKPPRRLSLVQRQAVASAELRNSSSRRGSVGAPTSARDKPESEATPRPSLARKVSARTAGENKPRRTSLIDRQAAAAAELRNINSRRGSIGGGSTARDKPKSAAAPRPALARKTSVRTAGENKSRRSSLVERQAAAAAELRSKLASRKALEAEKPAAAAPSSRTKGLKVTKTTGKRASLVAKQSAGSSSSSSSSNSSSTVEAKSNTSPVAVENCPEVPCEPSPIPESPKSKEDTGVLCPAAES